jgi:sulfur carrier protein ThiS adenylyltransferase
MVSGVQGFKFTAKVMISNDPFSYICTDCEKNNTGMTQEEIRLALRGKTVGIAGAGGLGSNCAVALVRTGVGTLIIADFDVVSAHNLNRQYYFIDQVGMKKTDALRETIMRIDHDLRLHLHDLKLGPENIPNVFRSCDVIVEAFDLADQKEMLIETITEKLPGIPLVVGLGLAGYGKNEAIRVRQAGNLYICGDEESEISPDLPPMAPRVGIVAHMQANVVIELLLNQTKEA